MAALDRQVVDRPPCVCPGQTAIADLQRAAEAEWPLAHQDAKLMARLAWASVTLGGQEGARVPFDTAVDASAFGAGVEIGTPLKQPYISKHPFNDPDEMDRISLPNPQKDGRAPIVLEAVRLLSGKEAPVLCAVTAPFSLACFLRGERETLMDLIINPPFIEKMLVLAEQWATSFVQEAIRMGADVIVLEDTWASGDLLSPEQYQHYALPGEQIVTKAVSEMGARTIFHQCGSPGRNLALMVESGADGMTIHQTIDVLEAKKVLAGRCATVGNLDPGTLAHLTPDEIRTLSRECMNKGIDVLAPACGLDPVTPLNNLKAMAEAAQRFRRGGEG